MKLSDVMSAAGLASYAEVGLILFMLVFAAVTVRVLWCGRHEDFEALSRIPLERPLECENERSISRANQGSEGEAS